MSKLKTNFNTEHEVQTYFDGVYAGYKVGSKKDIIDETDKRDIERIKQMAVANLPADALYMIQAIYPSREELTSWESEFLDSISEQYEESKSLSARQTEILKKIYEKVVG